VSERHPTARRHGVALALLLAAVLVALAGVGRARLDEPRPEAGVEPAAPRRAAGSAPGAPSEPGPPSTARAGCCEGGGCCDDAPRRGYAVALRTPGAHDRFFTVGLGDAAVSAWTAFEVEGLSVALAHIAARRMAADGRLDLAEPVERWLPAVPGGEAVADLTLQHVLEVEGGAGLPVRLVREVFRPLHLHQTSPQGGGPLPASGAGAPVRLGGPRHDLTSLVDLLALLEVDPGIGALSGPELHVLHHLDGSAVVIRAVGHRPGEVTLAELAARLLDPDAVRSVRG
jgi:hypothetical protein